MTIRLCRCDRFRADDTARSTCSVLYDHWLPESGGHLVGKEPRNLIWRAPCRRRHDKFDGSIRVSVRTLHDKQAQDGDQKGGKRNSAMNHDPPPVDRSDRM